MATAFILASPHSDLRPGSKSGSRPSKSSFFWQATWTSKRKRSSTPNYQAPRDHRLSVFVSYQSGKPYDESKRRCARTLAVEPRRSTNTDVNTYTAQDPLVATYLAARAIHPLDPAAGLSRPAKSGRTAVETDGRSDLVDPMQLCNEPRARQFAGPVIPRASCKNSPSRRKNWTSYGQRSCSARLTQCLCSLVSMQQREHCIGRPGFQRIHFSVRRQFPCQRETMALQRGCLGVVGDTTLLFTHKRVRKHLDRVFKWPTDLWSFLGIRFNHQSPQTPSANRKDAV